MSEVDASVALARVVAEALLRPTNTLNGYDLSGWPDQTSTPVVERDEESATATTMAAESAAVERWQRRGKSRAEHRDATSRRTRRAGDAHEGGGASDRVEWDVRGARGDAVRGDARGAGGGGGGEATFSSLVEYRRRGALERGRLAARAATATASARVKTEVHAVDAAVDAGRTSAPSSAAVAPSAATELLLANILGFASRPGSPSRHSTAWPSRARVVPASSRARRVRRLESINGGGGGGCRCRRRRAEFLLANILGFASRPGSPSVTPPLAPSRARVVPASSGAHDAFVVSNQSTAAAATGTTSAPVAANDSRLRRRATLSLHALLAAPRGIQRDAANARRYELLVRQQMAAMRHQDMGQGIGQGMGQGMGWSATAGEERMFAASEAHVAGDARGGGEETRGNRGGRGGGETREARLGETCAGVEWRGAHVWRVSVKRTGNTLHGWNERQRAARSDRLEARYGMFQRVLEQIIPSIDGVTRRSSTV